MLAQVKTAGAIPRPREGHAAAVIGQYFVISGGVGDATDRTGGHEYLGDTWALDTTAPTNWECLDDGAFAASLVWPKHIVATCFFVGRKLVTLQPNRSATKHRSHSQHLCEQQFDTCAAKNSLTDSADFITFIVCDVLV